MYNFAKRIKKLFVTVLIIFISTSIYWVLLYRFVNPPLTSLMIMRLFEKKENNSDFTFKKDWISINEISPNMILAVIAAEDNKFTSHFGIDWEAIQKARRINKYSKIKRGASTITQQTAKNVFLYPSRTYLRKVLELYFTYLIEIFWSKQRIMEVYLNVIELGRGIYGVEAATRYYFKKPASKLTRQEAAMLAAILPAPLKRNPIKPSTQLLQRRNKILSLMDKIGDVELVKK